MRKKLLGVLLLSGLFAGSVMAAPVVSSSTSGSQTGSTGPTIPYVGVLGHYEFPDAARDSYNGYGFSTFFGYPLGQFGLNNSALEFNFSWTTRKRHIDNNSDYQLAFFGNYLYDFGTFGWDNTKLSFLPHFRPFVLGGLGVINEDVRGNSTFHPGIDAGGGIMVPISVPYLPGAAIRAEARVIGQQDSNIAPGHDFFFDYHLSLGIEIPLTPFFPTSLPAPAMPQCAVTVVNPKTGRSTCEADSDHDGVPDSMDACPATPPGAKVNAKGCAVGTPEDSDGDGVPNDKDKCPNTPPGVKVDANGCPVAQKIVFQSIQFPNDSAVLSSSAKATLNDLARNLTDQPDLRVEIDGYTDNVGSAAYNVVLSKQRAESVRQYLIGKGVNPTRLTALGFGPYNPVASNKTAAGRLVNRRVEFKIIVGD